MKYIGKYGEHYALMNLLERNIEAYMAIKTNQADYDITVVVSEKCVKRIQVKTTCLQNECTNNSITGTEKNYDYLVLVIIDNEKTRAFVLTKDEAEKERGTKKQFSCSRLEKGIFKVKESLLQYENQWERIKNLK